MTVSKITINEAIVVEGRDDETAVLRAVDALVIKTHGFGIRKETWNLIDKAYQEKGLIIFTDPDFSGEEIRRRITERYPNARQAYLSKEEALRDDDIGVENASPEAIIRALQLAHSTVLPHRTETVTMEDLSDLGLIGIAGSAERRQQAAAVLGIGYGNGRKFLKELNAFGIDRDVLFDALSEENNQ